MPKELCHSKTYVLNLCGSDLLVVQAKTSHNLELSVELMLIATKELSVLQPAPLDNVSMKIQLLQMAISNLLLGNKTASIFQFTIMALT